MGLLKKLLSGGGGTRSEALGGVQSTGIFQGGSKQHCETDLLKAHGAVKAAKWAKRLQKLGFLEDQVNTLPPDSPFTSFLAACLFLLSFPLL
jgi:hypothetical protein